jgi:uncharacterized protein (TIGR02452 family)
VSRQQRAQIAQQTDQIVREGRYVTRTGVDVTIADAVASAVRGTMLHLPDEPDNGLARYSGPTRIEVTDESTLSAARRLATAASDQVACLNFASARKPGGGYRSGAQAQEESLARSSALAACLAAAPDFYSYQGDARYTDRVIYSPGVPVFRDDTGGLLNRPYRVAFLSAAAPNVSAMTDPAMLAEVPEILLRRTGRVLAVAQQHAYRRLVLGAWGCGVFGNDPSTVASAFAKQLSGPFAGAFAHIVFAILDDRGDRLAAFRSAFEGR